MKPSYLVWYRIALSFVALLIVLTSVPLVVKAARNVFQKEEAAEPARLSLQVVDGFTAKPVEGARVIELAGGNAYVTDAEGRVPAFETGFAAEGSDAMPQKDWRETALLIFADGYVNAAVFDVAVDNGETREFTIEIFRTEDVPDTALLTFSEAPPQNWLAELIKLYE